MKTLLLYSLLFLGIVPWANSQSSIAGQVVDTKGIEIIAANVSLDNTYDGTITDENGQFSFETMETGVQTVVVSYLGYQTQEIEVTLPMTSTLKIILKASTQTMEAVVVTANTTSTGKHAKYTSLKPLDIVTTAGANGDAIAALKTLPGNQNNAEDGRLFVKGGDAHETTIFIDGLKVFMPYNRTVAGTPTRGKYSPMLFKGINFTSGAYGTAYGDALSGVLDMNTKDMPAETTSNFSLMTVGVGAGHTQRWANSSVSVNGAWTNLTPYLKVVHNRLDMPKAPNVFSGEAIYRYQLKKGMFKSYISGDHNSLGFYRNNIDSGTQDSISIRNRNVYSNNNLQLFISEKTHLSTGVSIGWNEDDMKINRNTVGITLKGIHGKVAFKTVMDENWTFDYGLSYLQENHGLNTKHLTTSIYTNQLSTPRGAGFVNAQYYFNPRLAISGGIRNEYHIRSQEWLWMPRLTLAQKLNKKSQLTLSYGQYAQPLLSEYLHYRQDLQTGKAQHIALNYHLKTKKNLVRIEGFHKQYRKLIQYDTERTRFNNDGNGYAYGAEIFWRGNQFVKNLDFWVSYSWLQHQRKYKDYPVKAMPNFTTEHNLSVVGKYWIQSLQSQLSVTYSWASGRPYENPNTLGFLNERSKAYHDISISWAYLISQQQILYLSVSNVANFKNEYGYRYAQTADEMGIYQGEKILPNANQFFFIGYFLTISSDKTKNQLNTL